MTRHVFKLAILLVVFAGLVACETPDSGDQGAKKEEEKTTTKKAAQAEEPSAEKGNQPSADKPPKETETPDEPEPTGDEESDAGDSEGASAEPPEPGSKAHKECMKKCQQENQARAVAWEQIQSECAQKCAQIGD